MRAAKQLAGDRWDRLSAQEKQQLVREAGSVMPAEATAPLEPEPTRTSTPPSRRPPAQQDHQQELQLGPGEELVGVVLRDVDALGLGINLSVHVLEDEAGRELPFQPLVVDGVDAGSAAAQAGVRPADELLSVNGQDVAGTGQHGMDAAGAAVAVSLSSPDRPAGISLQLLRRGAAAPPPAAPPPAEGRKKTSPSPRRSKKGQLRAAASSADTGAAPPSTPPKAAAPPEATPPAPQPEISSILGRDRVSTVERMIPTLPDSDNEQDSSDSEEEPASPLTQEGLADLTKRVVYQQRTARHSAVRESMVNDGSAGLAKSLNSSKLVQALEEKQNENRSLYRRAVAFIVNPRSRGKRGWDLFMLFMVLFSSLYEPYKAAFLPQSGAMQWWEWSVDMCFYADMILNFWTGFDRGYEVVMVRQDIIKHYLTGWFAVDFVATVEWDLLIEGVIGLFSTGNETIMWFRLTRLLKVVRVVKAPRLILNLTKVFL